MRRCATCGEAIYEGEIALRDADGAYYCGETCFADALAEEVILDGDEDLACHTGPTWTYDEAVEGLRRYLYLRDRLLTICHAWRLIADERHRDARHMEAVSLRSCAAQIEDALADAVDWARGEGAARCGS